MINNYSFPKGLLKATFSVHAVAQSPSFRSVDVLAEQPVDLFDFNNIDCDNVDFVRWSSISEHSRTIDCSRLGNVRLVR